MSNSLHQKVRHPVPGSGTSVPVPAGDGVFSVSDALYILGKFGVGLSNCEGSAAYHGAISGFKVFAGEDVETPEIFFNTKALYPELFSAPPPLVPSPDLLGEPGEY